MEINKNISRVKNNLSNFHALNRKTTQKRMNKFRFSQNPFRLENKI